MSPFGLGRHDQGRLADLRRDLAAQPFSYETGILNGPVPPGMTEDELEVVLGSGADVWDRARHAIETWRHLDLGWVTVATGDMAPHPGQEVVVNAGRFGLHIAACCRVIAVHDRSGDDYETYGFTYGTLRDHPERGEERFDVRRSPGGEVRYRIHAMAAPATWYSSVGRPVVEHYRRRFRYDSAAAMRRAANPSR